VKAQEETVKGEGALERGEKYKKGKIEKGVVQRRRFERNEFVKKPETERTRITDIKVATQNETQPSLCSSAALWRAASAVRWTENSGSSSRQAGPEKYKGEKRNAEERRIIWE
jgi:hypothetical protein